MCCKRLPKDAQGVTEIVLALRKYSGLVGVAIETSKHVLVDTLMREGLTVYPINPKMSHAWQACVSVAAPTPRGTGREAHPTQERWSRGD